MTTTTTSPTIEELLLAKLQEQSFATEDRGPEKTGKVEDAAAGDIGGSIDQSRSAQSDNSGRNPDKRAHYISCCGNRRPVFLTRYKRSNCPAKR
jgi:hypothetical protein